MWFSSLTGRHRARSLRTSRKRASTRVRVEALEDRALLSVVPNFDFTMPDRFRDVNGDGRFDLPNTADYADPGLFRVVLDGTLTEGAGFGADYSWRIAGEANPIPVSLNGDLSVALLPEGTYSVTLT